jgi:hypothetical protein
MLGKLSVENTEGQKRKEKGKEGRKEPQEEEWRWGSKKRDSGGTRDGMRKKKLGKKNGR